METQTTEMNGVKAPVKKRALKGIAPHEIEAKKPLVLLYGPAGVGKTTFVLGAGKVYMIDTEEGATRPQYVETLEKSGGMYFGPDQGSQNFSLVIEEVQTLATTENPFEAYAIDSVSKLFNKCVADEAERLGDKDGFGASKKLAIAHMRRLVNIMSRCDMSGFLVAHSKTEWGPGNVGKIGDTFDCWDKLDFELDLVLRVEKRGGNRVAIPQKSRIVGFPVGEAFPLEWEEFKKRYGKDAIERKSKTITLATPDQVEQIAMLLDVVKVDEKEIDKWFSSAKVESWAEMDTQRIEKAIEYLKGRVIK